MSTTYNQNISDFYTQAQSKDFARQFQFRLVQLANTNFGDSDLVYVETASLPGRQINNITVPFMGLQFNVPGTASYPGSDGYSVTFRCDQNYDIRARLENATFNTFDDASSTGDYNIARQSSIIRLALLNKDLNPIREYALYGAYVVSIGDIQYNLGDNGSIVIVPAVLAYQYWRVFDDATPNTEIPATMTNAVRQGDQVQTASKDPNA
jgi:hypothetical protein